MELTAIDFIIAFFITSIGGIDVYYGLFSLFFPIATLAVFYKITTQ